LRDEVYQQRQQEAERMVLVRELDTLLFALRFPVLLDQRHGAFVVAEKSDEKKPIGIDFVLSGSRVVCAFEGAIQEAIDPAPGFVADQRHHHHAARDTSE
jgi:hypothetical protein